MSTAVAAPPPTPEPAPMSEGARLVNTFIAPSKTFTDLRRSAAWWGPFLVLALVSWIFIYVVDKQVGFRKVAENQLQMSPKQADRMDRLPADQRAKAMNQQVTGTKYFSWAFPLLINIWYVVIAGVLYGTFKLAASAELKFKHSFSIVMYSLLPQVIKTFLAVLTLFVGASADSFTFQNPVATNPGYFLNRTDGAFLWGLASSIDIVVIWTLILASLGFSYVGRVKRYTAMVVVFGWYAFVVLVGSGIGAAFS
jgi:Yip1-like protein